MRRVPVESSSLDSVGYEKSVLEVRFRNGGVYQYYGVPELMHDLLMQADSRGAFFNRHIRASYPSQRLVAPDPVGV
jgi:hypothetical protein